MHVDLHLKQEKLLTNKLRKINFEIQKQELHFYFVSKCIVF